MAAEKTKKSQMEGEQRRLSSEVAEMRDATDLLRWNTRGRGWMDGGMYVDHVVGHKQKDDLEICIVERFG